MKRILLSCAVVLPLLNACTRDRGEEVKEVVTTDAESVAFYSDWDKAIRADVDMQNMFANSPRKIEKPIDMYMAMALAVKYNYSRRMVSYEQAIIEAGRMPVNRLPEVISKAGYINGNNMSDMSSELKATWNILDMSTVYYQSTDGRFQKDIAFEQSRKVIHNVLQEARVLYWKALMSQKLLPVVDEMIEFMTLEVDEMNINAKALASQGKSETTEQLVKKREYMEAIKELSSLKRDVETSEAKLAGLMGFHPSTQYKLVGKEYGNFALPVIKTDLAGLEWLALTNRPEIRVHDAFTRNEDLKVVVKEFDDPKERKYKNDPRYYNRVWAEKGKEVGLSVFEEVKNPNVRDLETLRRQRMSMLVLSQVYVAWAREISALEDYQINAEIAGISENIAEDFTYSLGIRNSKSHLEASRAIQDEVKAYRAYVELQDSLGNLYSTVGLDALPYYMVGEKPSRIAFYLRETMERWRKGQFLPDNRPYMLDVPSKRPPVNLSSVDLMPNLEVEAGQRINVVVPQVLFDKANFSGKITSRAGLVDDTPLPKWLKYNSTTHTLSGVAMPTDVGLHTIKIYIVDSKNNVGYLTFDIKIVEHFVPSVRLRGLTDGRRATVLKRCRGATCKDDYIEQSVVGTEVESRAR